VIVAGIIGIVYWFFFPFSYRVIVTNLTECTPEPCYPCGVLL